VSSIPVGYRRGAMEREAPRALDQPALVDLVLPQQRMISELTTRVAELEAGSAWDLRDGADYRPEEPREPLRNPSPDHRSVTPGRCFPGV
jgi:hypothetical protein